jgi:hypothetical protein
MHKGYSALRLLPVAAFVLPLALSGCASTTVDEALAAEGESAASHWSTGEKMMLDGQALMTQGQEDINDGKALQREGEDKVAQGRTLMQNGQQVMQDAAAPRGQGAPEGTASTDPSSAGEAAAFESPASSGSGSSGSKGVTVEQCSNCKL